MNRAFLLLVPSIVGAGAPEGTPALPGWTRVDHVLFNAENLYGHIDGGAELYLEFGFQGLTVEHHRKGDRELTLEQYRMESPEAALGMYLASCGKETKVAGLAVRHTGSPYQITALKGRTLLQVINPRGGADALLDMVALANAVLAQVPAESPKDLFAVLPPEGRVPGSEFLVRGEFGLQPVFTFGEGDILGLRGKLFAVGAEYGGTKGGPFIRMIVEYADEAAAKAALERLRTGLDTTLTVLWKADRGLGFKDFQGKFGQILRSGPRLELVFHLAEEPKPALP